MDFPLAPAVAAALHAAVDRHDLGYAPADPAGLRDAFAGFAGRRLGWRVDPEQVTLVPDVMAGLVELCRVLAEPGDAVAFATPAYPPFYTDLPQAGVRLCEVPLGPDDALDLDGLDAALAAGARVLVLANPHNPTGHVPARAELEQIAERCAAHDAWVLADEIHAPLVLPGAVHTPWLELSDAARACGIALTSASKAFNLAGLKAALVVTASDRARGAVARLPDLADRAGLLGVIAAEAAFADGDPWLDAVLKRLDGNRDLLGDRLAAALPGGPLVAAPGHLPGLARLPRAGARRRSGGRLPGPRARRAQPRARLRPSGRRPCPAQLRDEPGARRGNGRTDGVSAVGVRGRRCRARRSRCRRAPAPPAARGRRRRRCAR